MIESLQMWLRADLIDDQGTQRLTEAVLDRIDGLRVEVRVREHGPPHFHVIAAGESNSFSIRDCSPLEGSGLKGSFRQIRKWHEENKEKLIALWNDMRPSHCPVGRYHE